MPYEACRRQFHLTRLCISIHNRVLWAQGQPRPGKYDRHMTQERRIILALFALALGLRIAYAATVGSSPKVNPNPITHELVLARNIASSTSWIRTAYSPQAPGYHVVLALLDLIALRQIWLLTFLHASLGALAVVFLYLIARRLVGNKMGLVAGLWMAISVHQVHFSVVFHRDILVVLLLVILLFLLLPPFRKMRFSILSGVTCAALIHVDPQFILLLPVFLVTIMFKSRSRLLNVQYLFLFIATLIVITVPWAIRNNIVYGAPVPVALEAQRYLFPAGGSGGGTSGDANPLVRETGTERRIRNSVEFWRFARLRGSSIQDPTDTVSGVRMEPPWSLRHNVATIVSYGFLIPFLLVGIVFAVLKRNRTALILFATLAFYFLIHVVTGGGSRVRVPVESIVILLSFYGLVKIQRQLSSAPDTESPH